MKSLNFPARFIDLATDINTQMPMHVVRRIGDVLNEDRIAVNGSRILLLGAAYKSNVSDMRESPAIEVAEGLLRKGAQLDYHDPHVPEFHLSAHVLKSVDLSDEVLENADLIVIVTDHDGVDYERIASKAQRIFDTRNATRRVTRHREKDPKAVAAAGPGILAAPMATPGAPYRFSCRIPRDARLSR